MEDALVDAGHDLGERDIVLVRTGRDEFLQPRLHDPRAGFTAEATHWLFDRGVRVMGSDALGLGRPAPPPGRRA